MARPEIDNVRPNLSEEKVAPGPLKVGAQIGMPEVLAGVDSFIGPGGVCMRAASNATPPRKKALALSLPRRRTSGAKRLAK